MPVECGALSSGFRVTMGPFKPEEGRQQGSGVTAGEWMFCVLWYRTGLGSTERSVVFRASAYGQAYGSAYGDHLENNWKHQRTLSPQLQG